MFVLCALVRNERSRGIVGRFAHRLVEIAQVQPGQMPTFEVPDQIGGGTKYRPFGQLHDPSAGCLLAEQRLQPIGHRCKIAQVDRCDTDARSCAVGRPVA